MICPDCFGSNVFCEACGGSGVGYCCDGGNVDMAPQIVIEPYPFVVSYSEIEREFDWEALQRLRKSSAY